MPHFCVSTLWTVTALAVIVAIRVRKNGKIKATSSSEVASASGSSSANSASPSKALRIGSRKSDLAMIQTWHVENLLTTKHAGLRVEVQKGVQSFGDKVLGESLKTLAAKTPGLFTKELEAGLLDGQYDAVVHSLKDMPTTLPEGLVLAGITEREDPHDALVVHEKYRGKGGFECLPEGAIVGTSSVRREAIIRRDYPHLEVRICRGNVNTRLAKLDAGDFDAIVLAVAGLKRLGPSFEARIEQILTPPKFMYGVSQGALGLQCRADDKRTIELLKSIEHPETAARCLAERALLRTLQGGCQVPLGVATEILPEGKLELKCVILKEDGSESVERSMVGEQSKPEQLGEALAKDLLTGGAAKLLESFKTGEAPRPLTYGSAESPHVEARRQ
mmetsp:Transcript_19902/g.39063  ORF Transcript_19902/g.39063 Transcript_19902/m.39063 type:complete len:390 (+) Transcript_19902:192-1361(+)|eukprot:CAMPEP_0171486892 /NCGR_PEP_ID=MMETSP0958-20121227/1337_1 /TAXON_ID=87120 /ORGANISM="Aurantiochytrium limacinum, Strain ATCCMYA-1381" /LENGTH=389 /DNA_ID=CAMNT_0012019811 /DNA_START=116 /DNA_END=1285 /DNA_ORIENTATION=-